MPAKWKQSGSLVSRGSRSQIRTAAILMTVIPVMAVCFIAVAVSFADKSYSIAVRIAAGFFALMIAVGGYGILRPYPENVVRLRKYLREIAEGELPDKVKLVDNEDDIRAIELYLNTVLEEMRRKMRLLEIHLKVIGKMKTEIELQQKDLVDAERHRVMIQSLAAACHHIGQPATVLRAQLHIMETNANSPQARQHIEECGKAVEAIAEVLEKLRNVSEYRTVPYLTLPEDDEPRDDREILDIENMASQGA